MKYRKYGKKKSLTSKVNTLAKTIRKLAPELKYFDSYSSGVPVSTGGTCLPLFYDYTSTNYMLEGTGQSDRNGDRIRYDKLWLNFVATKGDGTNQIRILIIRDKQSSGVIPGLTYVLNSVAGGSFSTISPINMDNIDRFTVLYDKVIVLDSSDPLKRFTFRKKLSGTAGFLMNSNSASELGDNQLYLIMVSDSAAVDHPNVNYYSRITYTDI